MRKSLLLGIMAVIMIFSGCSKDDECQYTDAAITVPASEITALETYLNTKGITNAVKDPRGFYYTIQTAGTGSTAGLCSQIYIYYTGTLTNDVVFDGTTNTPASFTLGELIPGWVKGIPLIKAGGRIRLYLPPTLAYGNQAVGSIPANSILIFDIELLDVR
jgi:FKBP-type peptidyl-prolyl cis-trans isomerase FkpA